MIAVLAIVVAITFPRSVAYSSLLEENLVLKDHLQELERKMSEVDRILLRLRLYDAQLQSLAEPAGDHGPLPADAYANARILAASGLDVPADTDDTDEGMGDLAAELGPEDLRPAEAWAFAVRARADAFLSLFEEAEPDLNALMGELEDLRALDEALPSSWPVDGTMTSGFGFRRNPVTHREWRFHSGLDLSADRGAPIHAAAPGKVIKAYYNAGYGRMIEIEHGFGVTTVYAHCSTLKVAQGAIVEEGQLIATVGSTGRTTGPHLHFEVRLDGHPVDPLDYLPR